VTDSDPGAQHWFPALEDENLYVPGVVLIVVGQGFLVVLWHRGLTGVQVLITLQRHTQILNIIEHRYKGTVL